METVRKQINKLSPNEGQIEGVPENPRKIKGKGYKDLKQSIQDDPEMLKIREVVAYDNDGDLVVVMGNVRLMACRELGHKTIPTKILPPDTPKQKIRAYVIKDNINYGDFDDNLLEDWSDEELEHWGLDLEKKDIDKDIEEINKENDDTNAAYPIVPIFSEKYDYVVIYASNEIDINYLHNFFNLEKQKSYKNKRIGVGRVVPFEKFKSIVEQNGEENEG